MLKIAFLTTKRVFQFIIIMSITKALNACEEQWIKALSNLTSEQVLNLYYQSALYNTVSDAKLRILEEHKLFNPNFYHAQWPVVKTHLDEAVLSNRMAVFERLLDAGASIYLPKVHTTCCYEQVGDTMPCIGKLICYPKKVSMPFIKKLVERNQYFIHTKIDSLTEITPLHIAVRYARYAYVDYFLAMHAHWNTMNHKKQTPLHYALTHIKYCDDTHYTIMWYNKTEKKIPYTRLCAIIALLKKYGALLCQAEWKLIKEKFGSNALVYKELMRAAGKEGDSYPCQLL